MLAGKRVSIQSEIQESFSNMEDVTPSTCSAIKVICRATVLPCCALLCRLVVDQPRSVVASLDCAFQEVSPRSYVFPAR